MVLGRKGEMFSTPALEQKTKNTQKHFITSLHTSKADHRWMQINRPNYGKYFALFNLTQEHQCLLPAGINYNKAC